MAKADALTLSVAAEAASAVKIVVYSCEARVLPEVISTASGAGLTAAEQLGDEFSMRHALAEGRPVQSGEAVVIGYDLRGLEPVYVIEGSLPVPYSKLTGPAYVLR